MTQASPVVQDPALQAVIAERPALAAMFAMLDRKELLADTAVAAATAEGPDYTSGVLAGLALAGVADLKDVFLGTVARAAAALAGLSFDTVIASELAHKAGSAVSA